MGTQHSYFRAVSLVEREFERVQREEIPVGEIERNINFTQLQRFSLPEMYRLNTSHVAVLYVVDFNKDGLYSLDDFLNFARWVYEVLPSDRELSDFAESVQSRCVLKMWSDCEDLAGPGGPSKVFVNWFVMMLSRSFPLKPKVTTETSSNGGTANSQRDEAMPLWKPMELPPLAAMRTAAEKMRNWVPRDDGGEEGEDDSCRPPGTVMVNSDDDEEEEEDEFLRPILPQVEAELQFSLAAVHGMYLALNVREAYGLPFSVMCKILNPALGENNNRFGTDSMARSMSVIAAYSMDGSVVRRDSLPPAYAAAGGDDFTVPEKTMRTFVESFIEAYWDILRRLGLHPLLTFAR